MPKRYLGNIITDTPTAPAGSFATSAASGVWSVAEANAYTKAGLWPIAGNFPLSPEDIFSTYLYEGTGATQTITNEINLSGEGGLVWIKDRDSSSNSHFLYDTERGVGTAIKTDGTNAAQIRSTGLTAFNSNGFTLGSLNAENSSGNSKVSWAFRKASKFFDVVTWTGDGTGARTISHNLGTTVGCLIVKKYSTAGQDWFVYHRSAGGADYVAFLNDTAAFSNPSYNVNVFNNTAPTDSVFSVNSYTNASGDSYVAYLFAHNDGDGEFGPDGDADIIKCGSYTGNNSTDGPEIDLGFEPQWLMIKKTNAADYWVMVDNMRGVTTGGNDNVLKANASDAELTTLEWLNFTPTGFKLTNNLGQVNDNGNFIYVAIRRGPMKVPTVATDVFAIDTLDSTGSGFDSNFVVDMAFERNVSSASDTRIASRLTQGKTLRTNTTEAEGTQSSNVFDFMDGWFYDGSSNSSKYSWMWKRAPNFCDVVAYTGNGTAGRTVSHNLGVAPEMIWVKNRDSTASWPVFHKDLGATKYLWLDETSAAGTYTFWNDTAPTDANFTVGTGGNINQSGYNYIAYLFASLDGVSKVGSYTGNSTGSTTQTIDCGFSSGARFVLIKKTNGTGPWAVFDTERGIAVGNDPYLELDSTGSENNTNDRINPHSSGFTLSSNGTFNGLGDEFIFYAIA